MSAPGWAGLAALVILLAVSLYGNLYQDREIQRLADPRHAMPRERGTANAVLPDGAAPASSPRAGAAPAQVTAHANAMHKVNGRSLGTLPRRHAAPWDRSTAANPVLDDENYALAQMRFEYQRSYARECAEPTRDLLKQVLDSLREPEVPEGKRLGRVMMP